MGDKGTARGHDPRVLRLSEIRERVEHLAEDLAQRLNQNPPVPFQGGFEAIPVENRAFIELMAGYLSPN